MNPVKSKEDLSRYYDISERKINFHLETSIIIPRNFAEVGYFPVSRIGTSYRITEHGINAIFKNSWCKKTNLLVVIIKISKIK